MVTVMGSAKCRGLWSDLTNRLVGRCCGSVDVNRCDMCFELVYGRSEVLSCHCPAVALSAVSNAATLSDSSIKAVVI